MKKIYVAAVLLASSLGAIAQSISLPPNGDNQAAVVSQFIGPVEVRISYHSPNVHGTNGKDRKGHIWGELVHYGYVDQGFGPSKAAPWRAGANENNIIHFSDNVKVEGKDLAAGDYGLFLATQKEGNWTWIFSKNTSSWGSYFYNQNEDVLRVDVAPQEGPYTEYLTFGFEERKSNSTVAVLQWENKKIPFKVEVPNVNDIYVGKMRNELRTWHGFDPRNWSAAAQFCAQNKINLDEALTWADQAMDPNIGGVADFNALQSKSLVLDAMGKADESSAVMDKAIKLPNVPIFAIHQYGKTLLAAGKSQKALEVFQYNLKVHPEEKFITYVGLARGYTAVGDKKNAIKNWEIALKNVPDNQKPFVSTFEAELKKLKG